MFISKITNALKTATAAETKKLLKPVAPEGLSDITGLFKGKVENTKPQVQAADVPKVEPKKGFDLTTPLVIQNLLADTSRSTLDKLKSLLPIPESLAPFVNMFLGKGTKADVKVGLENGTLNLTTAVKVPGQGIKGTAILSLPMTAQPADAVTELHPLIVNQLSKAVGSLLLTKEQEEAISKLPEKEQTQTETLIKLMTSQQKGQLTELLKLISTLPSEVLKFTWSNGSADIIITLPNGALMKLILEIPTSEESAKTPDMLRTFLKTILKENYAGIETFLSKDMIFNWDGSTSRFEVRFPKQLALHIQEIRSLDIESSALKTILKALSKNTTIIIPPNIRGTVDFKNPSIQFDKGTTFIIKDAPIPDVTIDRISYDPIAEKMSLSLKTSWLLIPDALLKNIEIDMKDSPKQPPKKAAVEKPNIIKYEFVPINTKDVALPETSVDPTPKPTISVLESLKQMIKIPEALEPLIGIFFADQTKLDVNVGIEDNLKVSVNNLNIPKLGLVGKASLSIPATAKANVEQAPVKLHPQIEQIVKKLIDQPKTAEEVVLMSNLVDLALTLPNQNVTMLWEGGIGIAQLIITLPGGMDLKLELDVQKIQGKNDPLMAKFLEVLDNDLVIPNDLQTKLLEVLNTDAANDPRHAQILEVLRTHTDKATLRTELSKVIERDLIRTKLTEILGSQFAADIEPLLAQTFTFKWNGETKEFSIKFLEQQELQLKSIKLKKGGPFKNLLRKFVYWITKDRKITLPEEINGKINLETASVEFKEGTSFTVRTMLGISKRVGLRQLSIARDNMIDISLRCFGTQEINIDTRTSDIETARVAIARASRFRAPI